MLLGLCPLIVSTASAINFNQKSSRTYLANQARPKIMPIVTYVFIPSGLTHTSTHKVQHKNDFKKLAYN